jgi:hypothetical protein|tara:strand:- start:34 stop:372 length:339 start_codon:yes stop_codon:yes gene_type:complete
MGFAGCRSSGLLTADAVVHRGQCKLISIHAYNEHAGTACVGIIYDNTAASGKVVAKFRLPPLNATGADGGGQVTTNPIEPNPIEFDMHGVLCTNGLYLDVTGGTPNITIEFA